MKLLDWMQHKFRQTNNEPPAEFAPRNSCSCLAGQPSLDDLQYYPKSHHYAKAPSKSQIDMQFRKSFACIETARVDDLQTEEEESAASFSQLFHGFLAIGTLAAETITNEPTTTFATYNTEKEIEATENEPKPVNDELDKMLGPEKPLEGTENNENEAVICPLQSYLFGSVIGLQETETKKEKENRTSLGELFHRAKMAEEVTGAKSNKTEKQKEKETEKSAVYLMKKILKGRTLNSSTRHSTADKKPRKILQMFHKKVHPERLPVASKSKRVTLGNFAEVHKNRNQMLSEDITIFPMMDASKKDANCTMSYMPHSRRYGECWIKSDAEYLVLEL